jgi:hypothetical protein
MIRTDGRRETRSGYNSPARPVAAGVIDMKPAARILSVLSFAGSLTATTAAATAEQASTAPSPAPSASAAAGPSDPCGSIISIVTRPTVTTSVCTVRTGHVLIENGYTNTITTGPGGGVVVSYPQSLVRIGTSDPHFEFSVTPPSFNRSSAGGTIATGYSDINVGAKYEIGYNRTASWGANAYLTIPSGARAFTAGAAEYTGNFNWSDAMGPVFSLSGTVGFNALNGYNTAGNVQPYFAFIPSIVLAAALPGPSSAYAEYAYFSQAGPSLGSKSLIDFGYSRDFGPNLQIDVEYGFSPTLINGQKSSYAGAGLSLMF